MRRRPSFSLGDAWLVERIVRRYKKKVEEEKKEKAEEVVVFKPLAEDVSRRPSVTVVDEATALDENYPAGSLVYYGGFLWFKTSQNEWVRGIRVTIASAFPSDPRTGDLCYRTDETTFYVYDGSAWLRDTRTGSGTSFPSTAQQGDLFFRTDEKQFYIYDGTEWKREQRCFVQTSFPSNPINGDVCYRTDERQFYTYDGTNWKRDQRCFVQSSFPASPQTGDKCYRTDENKFYVYDGSNWKEVVGAGVGFGTSFPSNPFNGQLFYRTDLKRMYAYNASASAWVAQEAIQTSAPSSPVVGELWVDDANNRIRVHTSGGTRSIGYINTITVNEANTVWGSGGVDTSGSASATKINKFLVGLESGTRTLQTFHAFGVIIDGMFLVNTSSSGSNLRFLAGSFHDFLYPSDTNKSVSTGNNDIVKADHPLLYVQCFDYKVLVTETSQNDFSASFVFPKVFHVGAPIFTYFRLRFNVYVRGQASFTYQFSYQIQAINVDTQNAIYTSSTNNFSVATNASGIGSYGTETSSFEVATSATRFIFRLVITRRRSAESAGNRPDDCYVAVGGSVHHLYM